MTKNEIKEFVEKVRGEKIKGNNPSWNDHYFIPNGGFSGKSSGHVEFYGTLYFRENDSVIEKDYANYVNEGLTVSKDGRCWIFLDFKDRKICECGMEKHGFASHSDWCPKT